MSVDNKCDIIPLPGSSLHKESQLEIDLKEKSAANTAKIKEQNLGPKIWHDSFYRFGERMQYYAPNEALAIPYASSMLAESLGDLPPLLLVSTRKETHYS